MDTAATTQQADAATVDISEALDAMDSAPPFEAVLGFVMGRFQAIDERLGALYHELRKDASSYKELPAAVDAESQMQRELLIQSFASVLIKRGDLAQRRAPYKEYYRVFIEYCVFKKLAAKVLQLAPEKKEEIEPKVESGSVSSTTTSSEREDKSSDTERPPPSVAPPPTEEKQCPSATAAENATTKRRSGRLASKKKQ